MEKINGKQKHGVFRNAIIFAIVGTCIAVMGAYVASTQLQTVKTQDSMSVAKKTTDDMAQNEIFPTQDDKGCFAWGPIPKNKLDQMVPALFTGEQGTMGELFDRRPAKAGFFVQFDRNMERNPKPFLDKIADLGINEVVLGEVNGFKGIYLLTSYKNFNILGNSDEFKGKIFGVPAGAAGDFVFFESSNMKVNELAGFASRNGYPAPGTSPCQG